jgi:hypothetical protein
LEKFEWSLLQTSKGVVIAAIALTAFCTTAVLGWQCARLLMGDGWISLSVSQVLASADSQSPLRYATASDRESSPFDAASIVDWFMALPALIPLVFALDAASDGGLAGTTTARAD